MITSILIPTDFSPASWSATKFALQFSNMSGSPKLRLLHVYPLSKKANEDDRGENQIVEAVQQKMDKLLNDLVEDANGEIENVVVSGNVEEKLMEEIRENKSDLVIVGVNSNGVNNEIGSHTIRMIEKSGIPVLIVPNSQMNGTLAS